MTKQPIIYATKTYPQGLVNETYDAFSLNRLMLEQEDLLGLAHLIASNFLSEPHNAADAKKVQEALRDDGKELARLSTFIKTLPDPKARKVLTKRYEVLQRKVTEMDMCLSLDRMATPQAETKSPLPKLLFTVGFPAGFATAMKALPIRNWAIGCITGFVWGLGIWIAYKGDIKKSWDSVAEEMCPKCQRDMCVMKQKPGQKSVRSVIAVVKCYARSKQHALRKQDL